MANYFNTLSLRDQLAQLGKCRFMDPSEFADGVEVLKGLKIAIVGCGAQGLNQGLNMRDSGLDISYALREGAIKKNVNPIKMQAKTALQLELTKRLFLQLIS